MANSRRHLHDGSSLALHRANGIESERKLAANGLSTSGRENNERGRDARRRGDDELGTWSHLLEVGHRSFAKSHRSLR